ncbi:MAG: GNAT family N-acetyltransferase [Pseudomonadota bacterium]
MTPERLAALHARSFTLAPKPWSAQAFADLLATPTCHLLVEDPGFAVLRCAGGMGEVLTLAVPPEHRRQGLATRLLSALEATAKAKGATEILLEVNEENAAGRALYARAGYAKAGWRKDYYDGPSGARHRALVLRKPLA